MKLHLSGWKGIFLFLSINLTTLISPSIYASQQEYTIWFVNGVATSYDLAQLHSAHLYAKVKKEARKRNIPTELIDRKLAYNETHGYLVDIFEAYTQLEDDIILFWKMFIGSTNSTIDYYEMQRTLQLLGIDYGTYVDNTTLIKHREKYSENFLSRERNNIVVGHSQGNLYANDAYVGLSDDIKAATTIIAVATPAGRVSGSPSWPPPYTTLHEDFIHLVFGSLPPNGSNGYCGNSIDCHRFVHSYLNGENSRDRILDYIFAAIDIPNTITMKLNDTGITWGGNYPNGNNSDCTSNIASSQDCHQGRDASNNDNSDGHAGFSFTKISNAGVELDVSASNWSCIKDNITGFIWEVKTDDGGMRDNNWIYSWFNSISSTNGGHNGTENGGSCFNIGGCDSEKYVTQINSLNFCGYNTWRIPNRGELHSIVDYGQPNTIPSIDLNWFPNSIKKSYWTSSPSSNILTSAWAVDFGRTRAGEATVGRKSEARPIRLVVEP